MTLGICCLIVGVEGFDYTSTTTSQWQYGKGHPGIVGVPGPMTGCVDPADTEQAIAAPEHNQDACDGGEDSHRGDFRVQHCYLLRSIARVKTTRPWNKERGKLDEEHNHPAMIIEGSPSLYEVRRWTFMRP
jgi:hypothetical protein